MPTPAELRANAAECEQLAAGAIDPRYRKIFLEIAERWRSLADADDGRRTRKPSVPG
jgi:hypothetical protein